MTERGECPKHKIYEDIIKLTQVDDITYEQVFRCGFKNRIKKMPPIKETIRITDRVEAKVIRFRSLVEGPILVSDNSGTSVASGSYQGTLINGAVTDSIVSINYNIYNQPKFETKTNINLQNILSMVDNNKTIPEEEKPVIKDTLTKINDIIKSSGSTAASLAAYLPFIAKIFQ